MNVGKFEFRIKKNILKNPIVILAQPTPLCFPAGRVGPELLMYYKRLTQIDPSILIAGPATVIGPQNRNYSLLRADQPKYFDGIKTLVKIISGNGVLPGIQLTVPPPLVNPLEWYRPAHDKTFTLKDFPPEDKVFKALEKSFKRCDEAGFEFVELDASNQSFLELIWDKYGSQSLQEIFSSCHASIRKRTIFSLRISRSCPRFDQIVTLFESEGGNIISLDSAEKGSVGGMYILEHVKNLKENLPKDCLTGIRPDQVFQ